MSLNIVKLSPEKIAEIRESDRKRKDRAGEADAYDDFTEQGKPYFFKGIEEIENKIANEIMKGNLYINTTILSRIKDQESALNNDDIESMSKYALMRIILDEINEDDYTITEINKPYEKKEKSLDDVFGITIIVDTEEEKEQIRKIIQESFEIKNEKPMTKDSYKAIHLQFYKQGEQSFPLIECQIKTIKEDRESREHTVYKVESAIERLLRKQNRIEKPDNKVKIELTQSGIQKVYNTIQQYFNDGGFSPASNIPKMWESRFNEEEEVMKRRMLSEGQTLKRMYKFLDMNGGRVKGE